MDYRHSLLKDVGRIILLAVLYVLSGKLGLLLAMPPGYATILWPPSGIAVGMLLMNGPRVWPGVFFGSLILNFHISQSASPDAAQGLLPLLGIAAGSTAQALLAWFLVRRQLGLPLKLANMGQVLMLFLLAGPIACLVAASAAVASLYLAGTLSADALAGNWLTWWLGDLFGVLVFLPLVLIAPGSRGSLTWRGRPVDTLPILTMLTLLVPLGLTFYGWKLASEASFQQSARAFEHEAVEIERALLHKMDTYNYALLGGAGFIQGSDRVSRDEWRTYVSKIDIAKNYPGINGIGYADIVHAADVQSFLKRTRQDGKPDFAIHPASPLSPHYVISYIEPEAGNEAAIGLDIGFEKHRREAIERARDTGRPAITKRVVLVQDTGRTPGFLLIYPIYKQGAAIATTEQRRKAFEGMIYAPFIARNFLANLVPSDNRIDISIYDGRVSNDALIFKNKDGADKGRAPAFQVIKKIRIMQQEWVLSMSSTPRFERENASSNPSFILLGGLLFTGLFGIFLIASTIRNAETISFVAGERRLLLPIFIFILVGTGAYMLYQQLKKYERDYTQAIVEEQAKKLEQLVAFQVNEKLTALRRMAQRWEASGGTPQPLWQADARNYVSQLSGLTALEWIDNSFHIRWVEPLAGNERAIDLDVKFEEKRKGALSDAAKSSDIALTRPLRLVQGYNAFIAYAPIHTTSGFDGMIAGVFSIHDFFRHIVSSEIAGNYAVSFEYEGEEFFRSDGFRRGVAHDYAVLSPIVIGDKNWTMRVEPAQSFVQAHQSWLPLLVFIAGLIIAVLVSLTVQYILISRLKSNYLLASEGTFRAAMQYASIGMAIVSLTGRWLAVNQALCHLLGYDEKELLETDFQTVTHPDDLETDLAYVQQMLAGAIQTYQMQKRYIRKDGRVIWIMLSVSAALQADGTPRHFIAQIQDITQQREMDRMKSEFISIVSHELRTPLTAVRGSLGLVLGKMAEHLPANILRLIQISYEECERLILLVNDILDIDKIASGSMKFTLKNESLAALLTKAVAANQGYADKHYIALRLGEVDPELVIRVDASRFQQILSNFISNAVKFSPDGGHVDVFVVQIDQNIRICVQDYGPGIPEEFRMKIFEKFSQADSTISRSKGGTGLGLHISKEIVEHMGGQIGFDTEIDKGTVFWAEFPKMPFNEAGA